MHIPDGFLDIKTSLVTIGIACTGIGWAARQVRANLPHSKIPLMGVTAAFVFAAQMINFPVAAGTSGHLLGGVLSSILLGPAAGLIIMTSILMVQSLVFADGGLLSLGANIVNMGLFGTVASYLIFKLIMTKAKGLRGYLTATAFSCWCSVILASLACTAELSLSNTISWSIIFPAMTGIHMLIGTGEAIITVLVISSIAKKQPELLNLKEEPSNFSPAGIIIPGLILALCLATFIAPFASPWPDGLEKVAKTFGFINQALEKTFITHLMPGYVIPGLGIPMVTAAFAGCLGTITMFIFSYLFAGFVAARKEQDKIN